MTTTDTITVRLPSFLKVQIETARAGLGMTLGGYVRRAIEELLQPRNCEFQIPGMTPAFDEFVSTVSGRTCTRVILAVINRSGNRQFYEGFIDASRNSETLVFIQPVGNTGRWPVLRTDVFAWVSGSEEDIDQMSLDFARAGWQPQFPRAW